MMVKIKILSIIVIIILHEYFEVSLFFFKTSKSELSGNILECVFIYVNKDTNYNV